MANEEETTPVKSIREALVTPSKSGGQKKRALINLAARSKGSWSLARAILAISFARIAGNHGSILHRISATKKLFRIKAVFLVHFSKIFAHQ
jgi:hypothetical protein